jgi:hypothetical protein
MQTQTLDIESREVFKAMQLENCYLRALCTGCTGSPTNSALKPFYAALDAARSSGRLPAPGDIEVLGRKVGEDLATRMHVYGDTQLSASADPRGKVNDVATKATAEGSCDAKASGTASSDIASAALQQPRPGSSRHSPSSQAALDAHPGSAGSDKTAQQAAAMLQQSQPTSKHMPSSEADARSHNARNGKAAQEAAATSQLVRDSSKDMQPSAHDTPVRSRIEGEEDAAQSAAAVLPHSQVCANRTLLSTAEADMKNSASSSRNGKATEKSKGLGAIPVPPPLPPRSKAGSRPVEGKASEAKVPALEVDKIASQAALPNRKGDPGAHASAEQAKSVNDSSMRMPRLSELKRQRTALQPISVQQTAKSTEQAHVCSDYDNNAGHVEKASRVKLGEKGFVGGCRAQADDRPQNGLSAGDSDAAPGGCVAGRVAGWPPKARLSVRTRVNNKLQNIRAAAVEAAEETSMMDLSDD